jgi:hypothetical protein
LGLFTIIAILTIGLQSYAANSNELLSCSGNGSKDGSGIMQPFSLKAISTDQSVKITIVAFNESL